ncbi:DEAD/DEAH box helicase family protein [Actinokineospora sp. HUAS TT18]|uniref:DEAD/DEAH box helicase family protein n=1 Tax=Actinokineospora sp. HUAS TT18 TaxID=3447451 RepID=UPI003F51FA7D
MVMERVRPGVLLRDYQVTALDRIGAAFAGGRRRVWVVLPPGSGKTVVGLEAARRLGRAVVVFGPNTAIQGQWLAEWAGFGPDVPPGSADRALDAPVTALTYQALAVFDPDAEVDEDGVGRDGHLHRLRQSGRDLVAALKRQPVTIVLDECHHLLDVWGELLAEVLDQLPDAAVIGMTATPPGALTRDEAVLVERLFGEVIMGPSIPAVVRDGHLAPYAELACLVEPTSREQTWLAAQADRFDELTTDLLDPAFATVPFLSWLDSAVVRRSHAAGEGPAVPWHRFSRDQPDVADAALRFHHAGLLELPVDARPLEQHRHDPTADDWMRLLHLYTRRFLASSDDPRDKHAFGAIRDALPGLGYQLTRTGIRGGRSPVDRVIARSAAKVDAVRAILATERAALGERLRALVVCDHERATATLPSRLIGVLDEDAGSAWLALRTLATLPELRPVLVTGRTVAAPADVAADLVAFVGDRHALEVVVDNGIATVGGAWRSRQWVPLVTAFFEAGRSQALIGTRALLGEGWNAAGVNTVVDLTESTTSTSVVQLRGRGLRRDPRWPDKTAHTWSVVCVAEDHPKGASDYDRFVRKHDGYFGVTASGAITSGVAHVHAALSPYAPPPAADFTGFNAAMLARCADRGAVRDLWRVGEPYADQVVQAVRVSGRAAVPRPATAPDVRPARHGVAPESRATLGWWPAGVLTAVSLVALFTAAPLIAALPLAAAAGYLGTSASRAHRVGVRLHEAAGRGPDVAAMAWATADALRDAGQTDAGHEAVEMTVDAAGAWNFQLTGVPTPQSQRFANALDEVLSTPADPRYLIERFLPDDPGPSAFRRLRTGWRHRRHTAGNRVVVHAVPTALGERRADADKFAKAWRRWVSDCADPAYTRTAEGSLLLAANRGIAPLDLITALRLQWT